MPGWLVDARETLTVVPGWLQALRDDAELRRKQEIHEAEESKNAHIQDLMRKHEKVKSPPIP